MADRVSFSRKIVCSDAFIALTPSARCLYFALCMEADYNGIVNNPKAVARMCYSREDVLNELEAAELIKRESPEDSFVRIVHWNFHFGIQDDACYTYHREREDR